MLDITKYISGQFSEEEFESISEAFINLKLDQDKKKHWQEILKKDYNLDRTNQKKIKKFNLRFFSLSLIASMLILVLAYLFLFPIGTSSYISTVDKNIAKLSNIMVNQSSLRKGNTETNSIREEATFIYLDKKYEESSMLWEQLIDSDLATGQDYFYLALCQLQKTNPNPDYAIDLLLKARIKNGPAEEISWVLSLAYLKAGLTEKGYQELSKIVEQKTYKRQEAKTILNLMDK